MRKSLAALGLVLLGASPALADAFSDQYTGMVGRIPMLAAPYTTGDVLSVVRNGIPYKVPLPAGVFGPDSSTDNEIAVWDGTTGRLIKDGYNQQILHNGPGPTPNSTNGYGGNLLFIGDTGETPKSNWLETAIDFTASNAKLTALSNTGGYGIVAGSRTGDNPQAAVSGAFSFGIGGFLIGNSTESTASGIAGFFQAQAGESAGTIQGVEINVANHGNTGPRPNIMPYNWNASGPITTSLWVTAGDNIAPAGAVSVAMGIINNQGQFNSGIMFDRQALIGGTGADGDTVPLDAIAMPRMYAIDFWNSGNTIVTGPASRIYSAVTSAVPHAQDLAFSDGGMVVNDNSSGATLAVFSPAPAGDCAIAFDNTVSGTLGIGFNGTAVSCGAVLATKNLGTYSFFVGATAEFAIKTDGVYLAGGPLSCTTALITDASGKITCHP